MTSKYLKYSLLFLAINLWLQAYSPLIYKSSKLFPDDYRNGDLYHLSYLPQFKEKLEPCQSVKHNQPIQNVNLYVIGDSFTEEQRVNKTDLIASNYFNVHWSKQAEIELDTNKRNILVLETVERTFREHFSKEVNNFKIKTQVNENKSNLSWKQVLKTRINQSILFIFPSSESIEQRFEASLFSYDFFLKFREFKAILNYEIFGRIEKKVLLSKDKKNIFFSEEASSTDSHSAFYPFLDDEKNILINNLNLTREKYLKSGFDEVYLSIIPNKVSVISPNLGTHNNLIQRIQTDNKLEISVIDVYSDFQKKPLNYYLKSDSHWTCEGRDLWLNKINKILVTP
ncbi:MAG: hypothetical protein RLZZ306_262 [Bacteroidota bacterium]|jgi:hypothetical protein